MTRGHLTDERLEPLIQYTDKCSHNVRQTSETLALRYESISPACLTRAGAEWSVQSQGASVTLAFTEIADAAFTGVLSVVGWWLRGQFVFMAQAECTPGA